MCTSFAGLGFALDRLLMAIHLPPTLKYQLATFVEILILVQYSPDAAMQTQWPHPVSSGTHNNLNMGTRILLP